MCAAGHITKKSGMYEGISVSYTPGRIRNQLLFSGFFRGFFNTFPESGSFHRIANLCDKLIRILCFMRTYMIDIEHGTSTLISICGDP